MTKDIVLKDAQPIFERLKKSNEQKSEYWSARELAKILGYSEYRHFLPVVQKAKEACINSGQDINHHFEDVLDMIELGKTATRQVQNILLSRYACYLIMQNADPSKKIVAIGQTYFAVQTRKQELFDQHTDNEKRLYIRGEVSEQNKRLFSTAKSAGVSRFGLFNDAGYRGLYGKSLSEIERNKGIRKGELLDSAGSVELAANLFRITQTEEKLKKDRVKGDLTAARMHNMVGGKVRQTIKDIGGILPENLPAERHIKEIVKELKQLGVVDQKKLLGEQIKEEFGIPELFEIELYREMSSINLRQLNQYLKEHPGDTLVMIYIPADGKTFKRLQLNISVFVSSELINKVESLRCKVSITYK